MSTTARTKRPTIRDVAAKAGVSKSLVSLVFSAPQTVSNYRKELVLKAADELGFSPSFLARSLATETGTFIGILVADLHNPLFAQIVDQVRVALEAEGESVLVVGSIPDLHRLASLPESVDIVIASAISKDIARATTVRSNDEIGMRLLIEHLVENGHQKISHISVEAGDVSKSRRSAYESVMKEKGLAKFINVEFAKSATEIDGFDAAARLMNSQNPPTAITAFNDLLAIGAQGATDGTVAITGYDNTFLADLRQISLTSVDPGNTEIADKAAQLLLKNDKAERAKTYLMEPKLIVRNSSKSLVRNN